jgi:REP element-mobilizing transposase RayT
MEVHAHTHTARKKWTHYFWEFLMLFFAVSAGFLVENMREHHVENKREKVFIKSFVEDLKQDTIKIRANIELRNSKIAILDSLMKLLNSADPNQDGASAYYWGRRVTRSTLFQANDRTIKQLKNSGGLRLIRNQKASNAIMTYDEAIDYINYLQANRETLELTEIYPLLAQLYDGNVLEKMIHGMDIIRPPGNPVLRTTDKKLILDLTYFIHQYKSTSVVIITRLDSLRKLGIQTIQFLQKEYHLK